MMESRPGPARTSMYVHDLYRPQNFNYLGVFSSSGTKDRRKPRTAYRRSLGSPNGYRMGISAARSGGL